MKILVLNCGSSSLKYQLIEMDGEKVMAKGLVERIGIEGSRIKHTKTGMDAVTREAPFPTHTAAIKYVLDILVDPEYGVLKDLDELYATGHRIVHGGEKFTKSVLVTPDVLKGIEEVIPLAPLHNPANLQGLKAVMEVLPGKPNVVVFDTAFHQTMPPVAYTYALPYEYYTQDKVRRYGFHGTSHKYVAGRAAAMLGKKPEELKLISCHLGNGSSVTAVDGGKSVDTSMGFTPLAGLPMGTRSGDLDAGILEYLMNRYGYDIKEMLNILNKKSGVLGVSGVSSDFRDLDAAAAEGNDRAQLALDMFHYWVAKVAGSYVAAMNGVDAIIFTAGVGENSKSSRAAIAEYFGYLGVTIDPVANSKRGEDIMISTPDSKVKVFVIPTNEELVIATDTAEIVSKLGK